MALIMLNKALSGLYEYTCSEDIYNFLFGLVSVCQFLFDLLVLYKIS